MKLKLKKENLQPTLVLGAICLVVALLMAVVNMVTFEKIEKDKQTAIQESLQVVVPGGDFDDVTADFDLSETTVTAVYKDKNSDAYAVTLSTNKGYTGNAILLTVGIENGVIKGAVVTNNPESKGVDSTNDFFASLEGKNPEETFGAELVTGVTYSSTAVRNAALDAFKVLGYDVPTVEAAPRIENFTPWSAVGIAVVALVIGGAVAYIIVKRRKGI